MREIPLASGKGVAIVDDEWYPLLSQYKWHLTTKGYVERSIKPGHGVMMHRVVNMTPPGLITDHVNGNKLDNRASNLRACTNAENTQSRKHKSGKSGFIGVSEIPSSGRWQVSICHNYKSVYIGSFDKAEDAARAYDVKARELHGEFAKQNFPIEVKEAA